MLKVLFEGVLLGLTLTILIGPSFFALIQTSVAYGFRSGLALAIGIFLSDLLCVILAYFGSSQFLYNPGNKEIMGVLGGIVLIIFGTINVLQKRKIEEKKIEIENINLPWTLIKGFLLNTLNPFVFIFWLGAVTVVSSKANFSLPYLYIFFTGTLCTVLATDILKSIIALKIRNALKPDTFVILNRIAGITLILFGLSLIYRVLN